MSLNDTPVYPSFEKTFREAFERYRYLERIAVAAVVDPEYLLSTMDAGDRATYAELCGMDEAEVNDYTEVYSNEGLDSHPHFENDKWPAIEKFADNMKDVVGRIGGYAASHVSNLGVVELETLEPVDIPQSDLVLPANLAFGEYDYGDYEGNGEGESDFYIKKYAEHGTKTILLDLHVEDIAVIGTAISKLHAALSRITGVQEAVHGVEKWQ